jgi:hypothetical protein
MNTHAMSGMPAARAMARYRPLLATATFGRPGELGFTGQFGTRPAIGVRPREGVSGLPWVALDNILMRVAVRLGLTMDYEVSSIVDGRGGVADTGVPNFIYRWTEREVLKTIVSFDPSRVPNIRFFHDLRFPIARLSGSRWLRLIEPLSKLVAKVAPKQCNEFAFAISKGGDQQPWITNY